MKKQMKFSKAMLKGFEQVEGRQCRGDFYWPYLGKPQRFCVLGAVSAGRNTAYSLWPYEAEKFKCVWGDRPSTFNDEGMPWEHIYGMAVAAGL